MADGRRVDPRDDDAEQTALADEARLIRRVRWRLVAWSGLSTLVILVVLGAALYAAVANSLEAASVQQLENRARPFVAALEGPNGNPGTGPQQGYIFGGGNTVPYIFDDKGAPVQVGDRPAPVPDGLPIQGSIDGASTAPDSTDVRTASLQLVHPATRDGPAPGHDRQGDGAAGRQYLLHPGAPGPLDGGRDAAGAAHGPARRRA